MRFWRIFIKKWPLIMKLTGKDALPSPAHNNICPVVYLHWIPYKGFASPLIGRLTEQCCTLSYVFKMATPRRFADKIAQLKQNQEAGTRAFEEIMKKPVYELEVCTVVVFFSSWEKIRWLNSSEIISDAIKGLVSNSSVTEISTCLICDWRVWFVSGRFPYDGFHLHYESQR